MKKLGGKKTSQETLSKAAKKAVDAIGKKIGVGEAAEEDRFRNEMMLSLGEERIQVMRKYILNGDMRRVNGFNERAKGFGVRITVHDKIIMDGEREYLIKKEIEAFDHIKSQYIASGGVAQDLDRIKGEYNSREPAVKNYEYANVVVENLLITPQVEKQWQGIISKSKDEERLAKNIMQSQLSTKFLTDKFHYEKAAIIKEYLSLDSGMTEAKFEQKINEHNQGVTNVSVLIGFSSGSEKLKFSSDEVVSHKTNKLEHLKQDIEDKYLAREMDEADLDARVSDYNQMGKDLDISYDEAELLGLRQSRLEKEKNEITVAYLAGEVSEAEILDRFDDHNDSVLAVLNGAQAERFLYSDNEIEELMTTRFDLEMERLSQKMNDLEKQFLKDGQEGPIHKFNLEIDQLQIQGLDRLKISDERIDELFAKKLKADAEVKRPRVGAHRSPEMFHKTIENRLMEEKALIIEKYRSGDISDDKIHKVIDAHDVKVSQQLGDDSAAKFQEDDFHKLIYDPKTGPGTSE